MVSNKTAITAGAAIIAAGVLYKGRDIRASLSMAGAGWDNLHPEVRRRARIVLSKANKKFKPMGLSVGVYEGWRTIERQIEVMKKGASFVADALRSYHPWGLAVDFVFLDKLGRWTWEPFKGEQCAWYDVFCTDPNEQAWQALGEIIEAAGFEWGGRWRSFDGPHAQYTKLGRTGDLIATFGKPDNWNGEKLA